MKQFSRKDLLPGLPGEFTVVKCRTCGLMRTNPRPTPETIGFYYPDDYGPYVGTRVQRTDSRRTSDIKKLLKPAIRWFFEFNTNTIPPLPPGRLLEVGCASGAFLHHMSGQGWRVAGIEFSAKASQSAPQLGYRVHAGTWRRRQAASALDLSSAGWCGTSPRCQRTSEALRMGQTGSMFGAVGAEFTSLEFRLFKERFYALHR
jgi:hypothetical protein